MKTNHIRTLGNRVKAVDTRRVKLLVGDGDTKITDSFYGSTDWRRIRA